MAQRVTKTRTFIKIAEQNTTYIEGEGTSTTWDKITAILGKDGDGNDIVTDGFYCEWLNAFGQVAIQQQSDGVICPARVRMVYVDVVYNALLNKAVKIYKNGIEDDAHAFVLSSSVDNYVEGNKMLEFNVKKYEGK